MKVFKQNVAKVFGIICVLALLMSALYVPMSFGASAAAITVTDDETVVFTFSDEEDPVRDNYDEKNSTRGGDGMGVASWGLLMYKDSGGNYIPQMGKKHTDFSAGWADGGGYRLNNKDGVYYLSADSTYVVTFKFKMVSAPIKRSALKDKSVSSYLSLGWGFSGTTGNDNKVSGMSNVISPIMTVAAVEDVPSDINNAPYTLTTPAGQQTKTVSDEWMTLSYAFTTPSDMGSGDTSLGFFANSYCGTEFYIDDVSVTKLSNTKGAVILVDEYYGTANVVTGEIDSAVTLPTLTGTSEEHEFKGWFKDADRTDSAEGITFAKGVQKLYTAWKAPVTVTFVDTLNNETYTSTGVAGEKIQFPDYLTDKVNDPAQKWFMGWYTTSSLTEKNTNTEFGYSSYSLYSKWMAEMPEQVQDFENYTRDNCDWIWNFYFGKAMEKIDDPTNSGKGKVAGINWDSTMTKDENDPNSYDASTRYWQLDNVMHMENINLLEGTAYTVTFDYYVKEISDTQKVTIQPWNSNVNSVWGNAVDFRSSQSAYKTVTAADKDGKWHTASFSFVMQYASSNATAIHMLLKLSENSDTAVYIDNVKFTPVQPYENAVFCMADNGEPNVMVKGSIGETIQFPKLTNGEAELLGWYTDKDLKNEYTSKVFEAGDPVTLYAKWSEVPEDFRNYEFYSTDTFVFGKTMSIINEKGRGYNDDYVLNFNFKGDEVLGTYENGSTRYMAERATMPDHCSRYGYVQNRTAYKVSFRYRLNSDSKNGAKVKIITSYPHSIWGTDRQKVYTTVEIPLGTDGWQYYETEIVTDFPKDDGNMVYLLCYPDAAQYDTTAYTNLDIDEVFIEEIAKPYITFDFQSGNAYKFVKGTVGGAIEFPTVPVKPGYEFIGWYLDQDCTEPFTKTVFEADDNIIVYAGYGKSDTAFYDFEVYNMENPGGWYRYGDYGEVAYFDKAYSGTKALIFDRDTNKVPAGGNAGYVAIGYNEENYRLDHEKEYLVTFKYYIAKAGNKDAKIFFRSASWKSYWHKAAAVSSSFVISPTDTVGVWQTGVLTLDASVMPELDDDLCNALYIALQGGDNGLYYVDDVNILTIAEGYKAYTVDNGGCSSIPNYVMGKIGTSFQKMIPNAPTMDNTYFSGYTYYDKNNNLSELTPEKMVFTEENIRIAANFVRLTTTQSFEEKDGYTKVLNTFPGYSALDFDYEIYDSLADGNSKDNVADGRYSLHRKGTTYHFENAQLLSVDKSLTPNQKYTITMKVKMGKYLQTDGAIKLVSNASPYCSWSASGDYHSIAAVKDFTDGEWHEVSFTFTAVEAFLSMQTPGYCELFIDDIVIARVDGTVASSKDVTYTEYVPAKRDANGNLVKESTVVIDVDSIVDSTLGEKAIDILPYIIVGSAVIIVAAATVVVLLVLKKRKKSKTV